MGVIPAQLKTFTERNYQVVEKEEHNMHKQDENTFDVDKDDTITILIKTVKIPGDPKKYSCLIKHKMHNRRGIFKIKIALNYH